MPHADNPRGVTRHDVTRLAVPILVAVAAVGLAAALSGALSSYYVFLATSAVVASINLLGLGVVTGSAGMIALCQMSFAAIGAWVVSALSVADAPGDPLLWIVLGALAAGAVGVVVGLPALRLRGVNLAVVTLGFAAAVQVAIQQLQFPGVTDGLRVARPALATTDRELFVLAVAILAVCALAVWALKSTRVGAGWRVVAFSERGAASAGASVVVTKLSAFAVSAALAGVAGGLVTIQVGFASTATFAPLVSLALYVLAVVTGSRLIDMAIFGGILWVAIPEILKQLGVPQDWGYIVFGLLGIQAITSGSNLGETIRDLLRRWSRARTATPAPPSADAEVDATAETAPAVETAAAEPLDAEVLLSAHDLTVRFGTVVALDGVDLEVREREIVGLIGPNGAGKSTMVDVLSGYLPRHEGEVTLAGRRLDRTQGPVARARLGLRRTFQQDRVPPSLTIKAYVGFVARRRVGREELDELLSFFGCPPAQTPLASVDVGTRRVVELAAQLAARPRLLLLDEPAAGLGHEAREVLAARLAEVPARFGTALVLIEHDLDMVRSVCHRLVVLDFGRLVVSGDQQSVLADPRVVAAYMGDEDLS